MERYVSNADGSSICATIDASYYKGTGSRNGNERELMAFYAGNGQTNSIGGGENMSEKTGALNCMKDQQKIVENSQRKYIVRRLTELECCRLQGLPDCEGNGWADIPPVEEATDTDIDFWKPYWDEWCDINGLPHKSKRFIRKWLESTISGSEQYKMYGNGIATPQWFYTCEGITEQYEGTGHTPTMASLFDGTGSFPYIWEELNGKGTAVWSSEVNPNAIRVSMYRIDGRKGAMDAENHRL